MMTRSAALADLARLRASTVHPMFAEGRQQRIAALEAMLSTLTDEAAEQDDSRVAVALARIEGGDQFDRGARSRGQVR